MQQLVAYSPMGAFGYVGLVQELARQSETIGFDIDAVVFASGSGCIHRGLLVGALAAGIRVPVTPIRPPSLMRSWALTMSTPVISSDTVCSTWMRGLMVRPITEDGLAGHSSGVYLFEPDLETAQLIGLRCLVLPLSLVRTVHLDPLVQAVLAHADSG